MLMDTIVRTIRPLFFVLLVVGMTITLTSCGNSTPSEEDGRIALENYYRQRMEQGFLKHSIKVRSFRKTNGKSIEVYKLYNLEYEAELEYLEDNRIVKQKGIINFSETENGWQYLDHYTTD